MVVLCSNVCRVCVGCGVSKCFAGGSMCTNDCSICSLSLTSFTAYTQLLYESFEESTSVAAGKTLTVSLIKTGRQ